MASYIGKEPARQSIVSDDSITSAKIFDGTIATADINDGAVTNVKLANSTIIVSGDSGSDSVSLGETLTVAGGTGLTSTGTSNTITIGIDSTVATLTGSQTLTNKTLGATTIAGHLIPDTNITYDLGSSTFRFRDLYLSGTSIELGSATITASGSSVVLPTGSTISGGSGDVVDLNSAQTLTNKTISSASNTITITESNISDLGAYLENVSEDTTPQLGGNLDLNSNDITGTGNINITGNATFSGNLTVNGTTTTVNSTTIEITNSFTFEGATADGFETVLGVVDPTADRTINLPDATGTVVLKDTTDTLTNKTINTASNTITIVESDISDLGTYLENISEDTTPQLGGNLDLNSNNITGTGNINITGTGTFSGDLTVDTNTLYVNSTNNRVGVGTTSPSTTLDVAGIGTFKPSDTTSVKLLNLALNSGSSSGTTGLYMGDASSGINVITREKASINTASIVIYGENGFNVQQERLKLNTNSAVLSTGSNERMSWTNSEAVINDQSNDYDFRVESNNNTHALFVNGGNDRIGIGTGSPQSALEVANTDAEIVISDHNTFSSGVTRTAKLNFKAINPNGTATTESAGIYGVMTPTTGYTFNEGYLSFYTRALAGSYTEKLRITGDGNVGIGTGSPSANLEVIGGYINNDANAIAGSFSATGNEHIRLQVKTASTIGNQAALDLISNSITSRLSTSGSAFSIQNNGYANFQMDNSGNVTINQDSYDADFRVESNNNANMLFVDGGTDRIGIGTNAPTSVLTIYNSSVPQITFGYNATQSHTMSWDSSKVRINVDPNNDNASSEFSVNIDGTQHLTVLSDGKLGIGTTSPSTNLQVVGSGLFGTNSSGSAYANTGITVDDGTATGRYGFTHFGATNRYLRMGVPNSSFSYFETNVTGGYNFDIGGVFNENGANSDFRVESDTNTHALFVDASTNRVGILNSAPTQALDVTGTVKATAFQGDGSALTGISGGKIAQVVNYKITDTTTITSGSYVDATGFTALNITPSSASSKIYINASINVSFDNFNTGQFYLRLKWVRNSTDIQEYVPTSNYGTAIGINTAFNTIDSPNSTSQVTYKLQVLRAGSGGTSAKLNSGYAATPFASYVTLMEVLA